VAASAPLHASDLVLFVGLGGAFVWAIFRQIRNASLLPERDPWLHESLAFENV
jgi:hypothetical protein